MKRKSLILILLFLLIIPFSVKADTLNQSEDFFVSKQYDSKKRKKVNAELKLISEKAYFYIEKEWYQDLNRTEKLEIGDILQDLGKEFDNRIYPIITNKFGSEWKPGIDNDNRITILFHQLDKNSAGYFRENDEYEKIRVTDSNMREMFYLDTEYLDKKTIKSYVAHELIHLITFNQKTNKRGIKEEVWLNEARAEYAPTLMEYDEDYENSNLQNRVKDFINFPSDSLTRWEGKSSDYGALSLFTQYLVGHYGEEILVDSLKSSEVGIFSINLALKENGYEKRFSEIFTDWTITVFVNNCDLGESYCYKNKNLKDIKIGSSLIFLPSTQKTNMNLAYFLEQWEGNWYQIIGRKGELKLEIDGSDKIKFKVPYLICKSNSSCSLDFIELDSKQKGSLNISNFGDYEKLILIPSAQNKKQEELDRDKYGFSISVRLENTEYEERIEELKARIEELKAKIEQIKKEIAALREEECKSINKNLRLGMENEEVSCLQTFLKNQGEEIYPEGLVTGYFGPLTQKAVIRFQEKYREEILGPYNLEEGTGYVGKTTKAKINELIK